ncbi:MAG: SWIM zinc finger domain-containing protein, partial [Bradymonadaceae bacterium]
MAITESDIPRWFGSKYAERGNRYQREGRVSDLRQVDGELRARCQGSQPSPYTVRLTLEGDEYVDSRCSCPIGGGCKHVAAVLYEYVHRSEDVPEEATLSRRLADIPRDQLVDLVVTYAERHPDFESWVEAKIAAVGGKSRPVDRDEIRRRVERIIEEEAESQSYRNPATFDELYDLAETAQAHLQAGAPGNAADILAPIALELTDRYDWFDASTGNLPSTVADVAEMLVEAFASADDTETRSTILRDL